jgi:N-glycosylase/DNA lyase
MPSRASPKRLTRATRFDITPIRPFNFPLTARKPASWDLFTSGEVLEDDTLWTGIRHEGRPLGLKLRSLGTLEEPLVVVEVYGQRTKTIPKLDELRANLRFCLGADQDLREFYAFARNDSILKHAVKSLYGMHDTQTYSLFNSVILAICLQMARLKRSREMMESIDEKYGDKVEFDGRVVRIQPAADSVAHLDPSTLARECKLGYRAKYIVASAKMICAGFPDVRDLTEMGPEEAGKKLMELPGIGEYAADIINPLGGFPIDAWSVDVFSMLFFGKLPKDRRNEIEMVKEEGMRRWGRWSWMAFFYVAQDLENLSEKLGVKLRLE